MKNSSNLFAACLFLFFSLLWQVGCNPDMGLQDPLRPKADLQVLRFIPDLVSPTQRVVGTQTSSDGINTTTRTFTELFIPFPLVDVRINNGVSALITGYTVVYTFQGAANPNTGLAVFGGPLNIFVDAATVGSTAGGGEGNGPIQNPQPSPRTPTLGTASTDGRAQFSVDVVSPEAETLLLATSNIIVATVTFFATDINGNRFSVNARIPISPRVGTAPSTQTDTAPQ